MTVAGSRIYRDSGTEVARTQRQDGAISAPSNGLHKALMTTLHRNVGTVKKREREGVAK